MAAPLPTTASNAPPPATPSQRLLAALAVVLLIALAWQAYNPLRHDRPSDPVRVAGRPVNLNSAGRAELVQIPGVGPTLADAILAHRKQHGRFESLEELDHLHGVGPKTLEKLRPWFSIGPGGAPVVEEPVEKLERKPAAMTTTPSKKVTALETTINVNTATAEQLQTLPAIGVKMAERIISERQKTPFKILEDLRRVSGIGVKTLEKLKPLVRFQD